jgi:hypothetical protein
MIPTYTEAELRRVAQRHANYSQFWADCWFETNRQPNDRYSVAHHESLRCWLIRYGHQPAPHREKV